MEAARLDRLPANWPRVRVKHVAKVVGGGTPSKEVNEYWSDGNIPWVSPKDMKRRVIDTTEDCITEEAVRESATNMVPAGVPLIVTRSGILRHTLPIAMSGRDVAINQDIKALLLHDRRLLPDYFVYWVTGQSSDLLLEWRQFGATVESIDVDRMRNGQLGLPDLDTQKAIADFLDKETARIDQLIEKKQRLVELLGEREAREIGRLIQGASSGTTQLKRVARIIDCKHVTPTYVDTGAPCISTTEVKPFSISFSDKRLVAPDDYAIMRSGGRAPVPDDIIYSRNASVGSAARVGDNREFCVGQDLCIIRPEGVDSELLELVLNSEFVLTQLDEVLVGATLKRVNIDTIRRFSIPLVAPDRQRGLARDLQASRGQMGRLAATVRVSMDRLKEYRSALITAAVTGQIDVTCWGQTGEGDKRLDQIQEEMAG
nr:restriction endonuclease subunit S [Maricaulis parjimensis]